MKSALEGSPDRASYRKNNNFDGSQLESIEEDCQYFDDNGVFTDVRRTETTLGGRSKKQISSKIGYGKNTP